MDKKPSKKSKDQGKGQYQPKRTPYGIAWDARYCLPPFGKDSVCVAVRDIMTLVIFE